MKKLLILLSFSFFALSLAAQKNGIWNNKKCAVVLTYDDVLNVHLNNAIPLLDSLNMKGTFYIIGSSEKLNDRIDEWRAAARNGHELGNHTLFHPCNQNPNASNGNPETNLQKYTVTHAINEIRSTNILLKAIDGKEKRSFAYPCGNLRIGDSLFFSSLSPEFSGARGVMSGLEKIDSVNLDNIKCYMINMHSADYMINLVNEAIKNQAMIVFLFHGVGGEHNINVALSEHRKLLNYIKKNEKDIWVAPMADVAEYIKSYRASAMK
jgi:peptidoglycan/xylan/chitin deacetylase (PgdA/CDA1 family)